MGEFEFTEERLQPALDFQERFPNAVITVLPEIGMSHHSFTDEMIGFLSLFLRKVAVARLPREMSLNEPAVLRKVKKEDGWLIERWRGWERRKEKSAPYSLYKGDKRNAFWCIDEEMARAIEHFYDDRKYAQLIGYEENGKVVSEDKNTMQQSSLNIRLTEDGEHFALKPVFLEKVPEGNPEWWSHKVARDTIGHASGGGPIQFRPYSLECCESAPGEWRLNFHRGFPPSKDRKRATVWFLAYHPGDDKYRAAVGPGAIVDFPVWNDEGKKQKILFPDIPDMYNDTQYYSLKAKSSEGLEVHYYVLAGPVEVVGDKLKLTGIPPKAKFPLKVTVVAWQHGRLGEPKIQTAEPVIKSFYIRKRNDKY